MIWPFNKKKNIFSFDTFYLTYDEPEKDKRWHEVKTLLPNAKRIDNIKGFGRAHKECAKAATTERIVIIDGDNSFLDQSKTKLFIEKKLLDKDYVFSYSSKNSINGLIYGNGGIKCWRTSTLLNSKTHEESSEEVSSVDFCFSVPYFQVADTPTISNVNLTSFQAFRAGYREGVKMTLDRGQVSRTPSRFSENIYSGNLFRLKVWCEVGRDIDNGIWAIYGSRLGLLDILVDQNVLENIRDYDWFMEKWNSVKNLDPDKEAKLIAFTLAKDFNFSIKELDSNDSINFKKTIKNPHREGLMFPDME